MFKLWLAWRYFFAKQNLKLTTRLGVLGLGLGVGSLIVAMAVVSGYEATLKNNLIDMVGHVLIMKKQAQEKTSEDIWSDLGPIKPQIKQSTPYLWLEGLLVHKGQLSGVLIEGVQPETVQKVLNFQHRITQGRFNLGTENGRVKVLAGKGLVKRFNLSIGDVFKVAIPSSQDIYEVGMRPKIIKLKLVGVMELGRFDYNERFIMMDLHSAQDIISQPGRISGIRALIHDANNADNVARSINSDVGYPYYAKSWRFHEKNMFDAVQLEKRVIFFVLLIMVIAACFNVSSTIFVSVLNKVKDISILKTIGVNNKSIWQIFCLQGLYIGFMGNLLGFIFGGVFCLTFIWLQKNFNLLPAEAYRLDFISLDFRWEDFLWVLSASMLICFLSSLIPAIKGSKVKIIEGVRYE